MKDQKVVLGVKAFLALFLFSGAAPALASGWPDFPIPDDADVKIVSDDMVLNGVPMQIMEMTSTHKPDDVLAFYREEWEEPALENAPGFIEDEREGWKIISRMDENHLYTVQLGEYAMGSTLALLSVSRPPEGERPPTGDDFPALGGTEFQLEMDSDDDFKNGHVIQFKNNHTVQANYNFYKKRYEARGWHAVTSDMVGPDEAVLLMNRGEEQVSLTFTRDGSDTFGVAVESTP